MSSEKQTPPEPNLGERSRLPTMVIEKPKPLPFLLPGMLLAGATLGIVFGGIFADHWKTVDGKVTYDAVSGFFKLIGDILMSMLKMLVVPLIVFSVMYAVASIGDFRRMGKVFAYTLFYFLLTMTLAVSLGLALVNVIKPGVGASVELHDKAAAERVQKARTVRTSPVEKIYDVVRGMFPPNLYQAAANGDVLGLIMFSLFFGAILSTLGAKGRNIIEIIGTLNDALMTFVQMVIWFAPIGIMGLVAERIGISGGFEAIEGELKRLFWYALTVVIGLLIHGVVTLPCLLYFIGRKNPIKYAIGMSEALLTAFTTASSSATLPVSVRCMEEKNKISKKTVGFVVPLGATVNMNGTALYEAVAAIFIAQAYGIHLSFPEQLVILITSTLAAIGAAAIPEAGLVTMVIVLVAANLPVEGVGLILSIDWILDRCRTTVNVWDDCVAAGIVDKWVTEGTGEAPST
ncbi:MAG: dicarboxylate/amino acid:cation symporter [Planctomycetota bacterium]|nr:dicarboxylate/amino acid:cation symporter [Planctomycetota bacterium]